MSGLLEGVFVYGGKPNLEKPTSLQIRPWTQRDQPTRQTTFFSGDGEDEHSTFEIYGRLCGGSGVKWAKLYEKYGWIYSGEFDPQNLSIEGQWGKGKWLGTFRLKKAGAA